MLVPQPLPGDGVTFFFFSVIGKRLEQDVKRLKADLQANRQLESELRSQLSSLSSQDRSLRSELGQLRQDNELLQNKWVHYTVKLTGHTRFSSGSCTA